MSTSVELDYTRAIQRRIIWDKTRSEAAGLLAHGHTQSYVAEQVGVHRHTIRHWLEDPEFAEEVDRLSLMVASASRAQRLRWLHRTIANRINEDGSLQTEKDVLELLKFAQSETTGAKIDLSKLAEMILTDSDTSDSGEQLQLPPPIEINAVESGGSEELSPMVEQVVPDGE